MRAAFLGMVVLALAACAEVPMATPSQDAAGKTFSPPPAGMATLYLYRTDTIGGLRTLNLTIGQRMLGGLASRTWFRIDLAPGEYDLRCTAESMASRRVTLSPGETRYLDVAIVLGGQCTMTDVDAAAARPVILAGRRAEEVR